MEISMTIENIEENRKYKTVTSLLIAIIFTLSIIIINTSLEININLLYLSTISFISFLVNFYISNLKITYLKLLPLTFSVIFYLILHKNINMGAIEWIDAIIKLLSKINSKIYLEKSDSYSQQNVLYFLIIVINLLLPLILLLPKKIQCSIFTINGVIFSGLNTTSNDWVILLMLILTIFIQIMLPQLTKSMIFSFISIIFILLFSYFLNLNFEICKMDPTIYSSLLPEKFNNIRHCAYSVEFDVEMENSEILYLKECPNTGYLYKENIVTSDYNKQSETFYWLNKYKFSPTCQLEKTNFDKNYESSKITISVKNGNLKYPLLPYNCLKYDGISLDNSYIGGENYKFDNENYYNIEYIINNFQNNDLMQNYIYKDNKNINVINYLEIEHEYGNFVKNEYTYLPESVNEFIAQNFSIDKSITISEKKSQIIEFISGTITTTYNSKSLNLNYLNNVFRKNSGTEADFAATTVCLARFSGIPSRMCYGYILIPENNENHIHVTDENYHIWAEIYIDGFGWTPLETFPEYLNLVNDFDSTNNLINKNIQEKNSQQITSNEVAINEAPSEKIEDSTIKTKLKLILKIFAIIFSVFFIALILYSTFIFVKFSKSLTSTKTAIRIKAVNEATNYLIMLILNKKSKFPEIIYNDLLTKFDKPFADGYLQFENTWQKFLFSNKPIDLQDEKNYFTFYKNTIKVFKSTASLYMKIYIKIFKHYY